MPWSKVLCACAGLVALLPRASRAQPLSSAGPSCPAGNVLLGRLPSGQDLVQGRLAVVTDGTAAVEGAIWNAPLAAILETPASYLTYDLGAVMPIQALFIQADANDTYTVSGSMHGDDYRTLGEIGPVTGHGLRSRALGAGGVFVRYLRLAPASGDGSYSVSEIQAFCQIPTPFPPKLPTKDAPPAVGPAPGFRWDNDTAARWELILALFGFAWLVWGRELAKEGNADAHRKTRDRILMVLGVLAPLTYVNFGAFHFGNFIHNWDAYHYYVGAKYFPEIGYSRLYDCTAVADAENPSMRRRVEARKQTNLRTNVLEPTTEILKHPERCKDHFTPERWAAYKHDTTFFRLRESPKRWDDAQTDHGYNGTPVWNIAGTLLSNLAPASKTQLLLLTLLDQAYLVAMILAVWWAFGWRVLAVALLVFATNFPSRFYWTGGSILRWDWLFYSVGAVCCLRKERPLLGGVCLGYATLLRVFPGFLFVGPLLALGHHWVKHRRIEPRYLRFFAGGALAAALLIPISFVTSGGRAGIKAGIGAYQEFVQNTAKHKETPLTNYMGLRTVVAYRPSTVGRHLRSNQDVDPWLKWKVARLQTFKERRPLYALLVVGFLAALGLVSRRLEPWAVAASSTMLIAVGVELTSYYYAFLIAVALLHDKDEAVGRWLLALTAFTQFVAWAPLTSLMSTWLDEQYTLMSVGTLVAFGVILYLLQRDPKVAAQAATDQ